MEDMPVFSPEDLTKRTMADSACWHHRWFRGAPDRGTDSDCLVPLLYRERRRDGHQHDENELLQHIRVGRSKLRSRAHSR